MNIEVFLQIFLWFKFCTSVQICIYLPTFVLIYTLCNRCCPTERYIRTVRIPGDLWMRWELLDQCQNCQIIRTHSDWIIGTPAVTATNENGIHMNFAISAL